MRKRFFDIIVSLLLIFLASPVILAAMIWVKLDSRGPVLFKQSRVGRGGGIFTIYKLRTMVADAEQRGGYATKQGDPRITRSGSFLRRTSLDELPQLFNVLLGSMSLVGPRPDTPMQKDQYTPEEWKMRTRVRPGITGLAQARLRSSATHQERLALDLQYVERADLGSDIAILWETARTLLKRKAF